jgi:hypothetical protein
LLLAFRCWTGDEEFDPWVAEVEDFVRMIALKTADHVLLFESESGDLAGVSAFDREDYAPSGPFHVPIWRLEAIALSLAWQGTSVDADIDGCPGTMKASEYVLRGTFRRMLELDPRRTFLVGRIHNDNRASMKATARVGLDQLGQRVLGEYLEVLGEVDPAARCAG